MKNYYYFLLAIFLLPTCVMAQNVQRTFRGIYTDDSHGMEGLYNPERSFRLEVSNDLEKGGGLWESKETLSMTAGFEEESASYASDSVSLVQSYFYLLGYAGKNLPAEAFQRMDIYFNALRKAGKKAVLRFAYELDFNGRAKEGPTKEDILRHIVQLKPFLEKNKDVIYVLQAGMVGAWGEWHSSYRGLENSEDTIRTILQNICKMAPTNRAIQIRLPKYKNLLDTASADYKRISFHDDFIIDKPHHWDGDMSDGTPAYNQIVRESPYLPVDGELPWGSWSMNEDSNDPVGGWLIDGVATARRLFEQHYSSLSAIHNYKENDGKQKFSMMYWKETPITETYLKENRMPISDGYFRKKDGTVAPRMAFDYIRDHLGYRIELQKLDVHPLSGKQKKTLSVELSLINRGFSTLFNEHPAHFVVLDKDDKVCYTQLCNADVHSWQPYEPTDTLCKPLVHKVTADISLPENLRLKKGYKLGLWIPDGSERLKYNPRYAIRCANGDIQWLCTKDGKYGINVLCTF